MNDLDLHIHSVELSFNNTWSKKKKKKKLDPDDVSKIEMSGVTEMEMKTWLGHWSPKYVSC